MCDHCSGILDHFGADSILQGEDVDVTGNLTIVGFTNRSGSTVVCSALSRLGLAGSPNKYLNYEFLNSDAVSDATNVGGIDSFLGYLQDCVARYSSSRNCFTMKASIQQLNFLLESGVLRKFRTMPKFIWVRRRNVLAQAISLSTAVQDGMWTSLHDRSGLPSRFDEESVLLMARSIYEANAWFEMFFDYHGICPLIVWYEDFAENETRLLADLAQFFALVAYDLAPSALPVAKQSTSQKVNWEKALRVSGRGYATD
jgi:LPS sulfotransferase NodH